MATLSTSHLTKVLQDRKVDAALAKSYIAVFRILANVGQYPAFDIRAFNSNVNVSFKADSKIDPYHIEDILNKGGVKAKIEGKFIKTPDLTIYIDHVDRVIIVNAIRSETASSGDNNMATLREQVKALKAGKKETAATKVAKKDALLGLLVLDLYGALDLGGKTPEIQKLLASVTDAINNSELSAALEATKKKMYFVNQKLSDQLTKATGVSSVMEGAELAESKASYTAAANKLPSAEKEMCISLINKSFAYLDKVNKDETASVEIAKASTKKMAAKIAAIAQNMKLTEKQWDGIDKAVRKLAFGGKEKAAVEVAAKGGTQFSLNIEPINMEGFKKPTILFQVISTGDADSHLVFNEFMEYVNSLNESALGPLNKLGEVEVFDDADFALRPKNTDKKAQDPTYDAIGDWLVTLVTNFAKKKKVPLMLKKGGKWKDKKTVKLAFGK